MSWRSIAASVTGGIVYGWDLDQGNANHPDIAQSRENHAFDAQKGPLCEPDHIVAANVNIVCPFADTPCRGRSAARNPLCPTVKIGNKNTATRSSRWK